MGEAKYAKNSKFSKIFLITIFPQMSNKYNKCRFMMSLPNSEIHGSWIRGSDPMAGQKWPFSENVQCIKS